MKYAVIEDTSFLPLGETVVDSVFNSLNEAEQYLSTQFCYLEWEHPLSFAESRKDCAQFMIEGLGSCALSKIKKYLR